jgi:hypothetical protein
MVSDSSDEDGESSSQADKLTISTSNIKLANRAEPPHIQVFIDSSSHISIGSRVSAGEESTTSLVVYASPDHW